MTLFSDCVMSGVRLVDDDMFSYYARMDGLHVLRAIGPSDYFGYYGVRWDQVASNDFYFISRRVER